MVLRLTTAATGRLWHWTLHRTSRRACSYRSSTSASAAASTALPTIHRRGDHPYGSREYLLCRPASPELVLLLRQKKKDRRRESSLDPNDDDDNNSNDDDGNKKKTSVQLPTTVEGADGQILQVLATLKANRHILFGASARPIDKTDNGDGSRHIPNLCRPLVTTALDDCQAWGEQPQALAALYGLCDYVVHQCLPAHPVLSQLNEPDRAAITALATTGRLPTGYDTITTTTSTPTTTDMNLDNTDDESDNDKDDQSNNAAVVHAWDALAREYATTTAAYECELYRTLHFELIGVEWMADTQTAYLQSAGGAMARYFYMAERDETVPYRWKEKK